MNVADARAQGSIGRGLEITGFGMVDITSFLKSTNVEPCLGPVWVARHADDNPLALCPVRSAKS